MILACVFIVLGFFFLVKGADVFVDSASGVATKLGVPTLVIGLTIVAFGTSMPELAVSVTAALEKANEIAVGNVVGSNIFNLLVVGGLSACIYPLIVNPAIMKRDWPLSTLAAGVLFLFLLPDLTISRIEAAILLVCFGFLLYVQIKHTKNETEEKKEEHRSMPKLLLLLVLGIAGIVIGGKLTVEGATSLARILGLSETLIGLDESTGRAYPGTGDLFSAVLLGALLKGLSLRKAAEAAHRFVAHCIQKSDAAGYDTREGVLLEPELLELVKIVS